MYVATYINGTDERSKIIRRNIVRYTVLNEAMVFRDVSPVVRRRFPDDDAFKTAGNIKNSAFRPAVIYQALEHINQYAIFCVA
jgi:hypothetical protein